MQSARGRAGDNHNADHLADGVEGPERELRADHLTHVTMLNADEGVGLVQGDRRMSEAQAARS